MLYFITKIAKGLFTVSLALLGGTAVLLYAYQTKLVYPADFPEGSRRDVPTPDEFGMNTWEDVTLESDGLKIKGYLIPLEDEDLARTRPTVLILHANAGNMGHRLPLALQFKRLQCNVFLLSYRGYGLSEGSPSERGLRMDAQTALDYLLSHPLLSSTPIILYGQSIGGAVSIDLTSRNPTRIAALILENTFLSIPSLIPALLPLLRPFTPLCTEVWDSASALKRLISSSTANSSSSSFSASSSPSSASFAKTGAPRMLFLSGRRDEIVPPAQMDALFAIAGGKKEKDGKEKEGEGGRGVVEWWECGEGTHNDTCMKPGYWDAVRAFLGRVVEGLGGEGRGEKLGDESFELLGEGA